MPRISKKYTKKGSYHKRRTLINQKHHTRKRNNKHHTYKRKYMRGGFPSNITNQTKNGIPCSSKAVITEPGIGTMSLNNYEKHMEYKNSQIKNGY